MATMDASQTALDSLRTVEFRETLKGYHRDDVDEYLERAAVEAEGLQEQLRQSGERLRQAAERISELEATLANQPEPQPAEPAVPDDTLQRTLLLAQQFVDQTKADSEAQARRIISEADAKARMMTDQAQAHASKLVAESEQRLREEIGRLEGAKQSLAREIEVMSQHLETERRRLRAALGEMLTWVDDHVHPIDDEGLSHESESADAAGTIPAPSNPTSQPVGNRPVAGSPSEAPSPTSAANRPVSEMTRIQAPGTVSRPTNATLPL